jgi:hypothetical protein
LIGSAASAIVAPMAGKPGKRTSIEAADVSVKVDATLKRRYGELAKSIADAKKRGASAFDALWEAVGEVLDHDPPLYVVAGYRDADEFLREELGETRRTGFRFVRVAKFASPREEAQYGTTKLDAALSFIEAKVGAPLAHPPLPIAFDRLRIPLKKGTCSLEDARVEDIVVATRALAKRERKPTSSLERAAKEKLKDHAALANVGVRVRGGLVTLTNVPVAALQSCLRVLASVRWQDEEKKKEKKARPTKTKSRTRSKK